MISNLITRDLAQIDNRQSRAYLNRQVAVLISLGSTRLNRIVDNSEILTLDSTGIVDKIPCLRAESGAFRATRREAGIHLAEILGELYKAMVIGELPYDPSNE